MSLPQKIVDIFFTPAARDLFERQVATADAMTDKADRLLAYHDLQARHAPDISAAGHRLSRLSVGALVCGVVLTAVIKLPVFVVAGLAYFGGVQLARAMAKDQIAATRQRVTGKIATLEAAVDLDDIARSPKLEALLGVSASLKQRFQDRALHSAIRAQAAPREPLIKKQSRDTSL